MQTTVGVIGLGVMGRAMADNLVKAGFRVSGFDVSPDAKNWVDPGVTVVPSLEELAPQVEIMLLSLPNAAICRDVIATIVSHAQPGALIADASTIAPQDSERLAETVHAAGMQYVAAPVVGGQPGAIAGTLTIIVGGAPDELERIDPVLRAIGEQIHKVGAPREASTLKLVNNMMSLGNTIVFAEAIALARSMGIDVARVYDVVKDGSGASAALDRRFHMNISVQNYEPGFSIALAHKDLTLALESATAAGLELPSIELARNKYESLMNSGMGARDVSAVVLHWESIVDEIASKNTNAE